MRNFPQETGLLAVGALLAGAAEPPGIDPLIRSSRRDDTFFRLFASTFGVPVPLTPGSVLVQLGSGTMVGQKGEDQFPR